jgi:hypothetical protein
MCGPGYNEVAGQVYAIDDPIVSPLSGERFVWWSYRLDRVPTRNVPVPGVLELAETTVPFVVRETLLGPDLSSRPLSSLPGDCRLTERGLRHGAIALGSGMGEWDDAWRAVVLRPPITMSGGTEAKELSNARWTAAFATVFGSAMLTASPVVGRNDGATPVAAVVAAGCIVVLALAASYVWRCFDRVARARVQVASAQSMIEVAERQRVDLVPLRTEVVASAFAHERDLIVALADGPSAEVVREAVPRLSSHEAAARLADELMRCEDRLAFARRHHLDAMAVWRDRCERIPARFLVPLAGSTRT